MHPTQVCVLPNTNSDHIREAHDVDDEEADHGLDEELLLFHEFVLKDPGLHPHIADCSEAEAGSEDEEFNIDDKER